MAPKKKPAAKKPAAKSETPIPADAAETQAVAVENLALALNRAADGFQAIGDLVVALLSRPTTADRASLLDRLVVAAEKQTDARLRIAATLEAEEQRHAREAEADEKRSAERHAADMKAAADHVATIRGFFARVEAGEVRVTSTGPSGGPEVAFGRTPAAAAPEAAPFPSQTYEGGTATPIVAVSTPEATAAPPVSP